MVWRFRWEGCGLMMRLNMFLTVIYILDFMTFVCTEFNQDDFHHLFWSFLFACFVFIFVIRTAFLWLLIIHLWINSVLWKRDRKMQTWIYPAHLHGTRDEHPAASWTIMDGSLLAVQLVCVCVCGGVGKQININEIIPVCYLFIC